MATGQNLNAAFVLPVVGTVRLLTTEISLSNDRASEQDVLLVWLPEGGSAGRVQSFRLTLPAKSDATGGALIMADFADRLGVSGIGSLAVFAIDRNSGNLDSNASITGFSQIWTHPPFGYAPFSQSISAVRSTLFSAHARATATGFHHDMMFRTNVGIVNLSSEWHQFRIAINGDRTSAQFTIAVPPFSLVQTPVPNGDYGASSLVVSADSSGTPWLFYGSSINNFTGDAQNTIGTPGND